jgi:hypothetical protein
VGGIVKASPERTGRQSSPFESDEPDREVVCIDCKRPTPITGYAWGLAKVFSEQLIARGEPALANDEMTRCRPCSDAWQAKQLALSHHVSWRINDLVASVKQGGEFKSGPRNWLRDHGYYEDIKRIDEIVKRVAEGKKSGAGKGRAKL